MWRNNVPALKKYLNCAIEEWVERGFKNTMDFEDIDEEVEMPEWFGNEKFHSSHRANLLKKEPEFYSQYRWSEDPSNPYVWMDKDGKWYEQHSGQKGRVYYEEDLV
jgi:hypothetical protein